MSRSLPHLLRALEDARRHARPVVECDSPGPFIRTSLLHLHDLEREARARGCLAMLDRAYGPALQLAEKLIREPQPSIGYVLVPMPEFWGRGIVGDAPFEALPADHRLVLILERPGPNWDVMTLPLPPPASIRA